MYSFHAWGVVTPGVWMSLPSTHNVECRPYRRIANFLSCQRAIVYTLPPPGPPPSVDSVTQSTRRVYSTDDIVQYFSYKTSTWLFVKKHK